MTVRVGWIVGVVWGGALTAAGVGLLGWLWRRLAGEPPSEFGLLILVFAMVPAAIAFGLGAMGLWLVSASLGLRQGSEPGRAAIVLVSTIGLVLGMPLAGIWGIAFLRGGARGIVLGAPWLVWMGAFAACYGCASASATRDYCTGGALSRLAGPRAPAPASPATRSEEEGGEWALEPPAPGGADAEHRGQERPGGVQ